MVAFPLRVYVHFAQLDGFFEMGDVPSAKACILDMFPDAVFSDWQRVDSAEVVVAWADSDQRTRQLLSDEPEDAIPDAYVICLVCPIEILSPTALAACLHERGALA